ncbi:unnamed protein product [Paramecium octaurelia]|uniref:MIR domain-containing protein n=1 Tax=Paramecium octaurelia TaxID=43137 RepID=A0A8S1US54_PAROT|nr:unnamed protein product [Paramecium octaurelia]
MGQCITKEGDEQRSIQRNSQKPTIQPLNRTYSSKLLNPNITDCVILEEESYLQQSSLYSIYTIMEENQVKRSTLANAVSKVKPLGSAITSGISVQFINISNGRKLHSHAIKQEKGLKQHEVSLCNEIEKNDYDEWLILTNHYEPVKDGDVVAIQHKITKCILRSSNNILTKSKLQQVSCVDIIQDLTEDDYWIIEIINDSKQINKLHSNNLIRIKHAQTNTYLSGTKNKAVLKGHMEVCVTQQPGHDIWVVEDTF